MAFAPVARRAVTPYKSAIFFENSAEQRAAIIERCPSVKVIKESLDEAPADTTFIIVDIPETEPPPIFRVTELPFYNESNEYIVRNNILTETYDSISGVQEGHIDNILTPWIASRSEGAHVAIFDWDRTTTVIEGIRMRGGITGSTLLGGDPTAYYNDLLVHVCGGKERFDMLQNMFRQLVSAGIHIMFLTNNPSGRYIMFDEMISLLVGASAPTYSIIVSHGHPYGGVKANVFSSEPRFVELACKKRPVRLAPIPSALPVAFQSFAPIAPSTGHVPKFFPNGTENLYGNLDGGRRRKTMRRRSKTLRRIMRRMMRQSRRTRCCGKTRRQLL